jgi:hypothetical protein
MPWDDPPGFSCLRLRWWERGTAMDVNLLIVLIIVALVAQGR